MKPAKKEVSKKKSKKTIDNIIDDSRIKSLEDLVVLMDEKIISLQKDMEAIKDVHIRLRQRMGL
tara:strand:+ start:1454 stop:1645 length:192 start_codon:yes stop_codon:yes gene_type:complete